jgi:hypothetical protein
MRIWGGIMDIIDKHIGKALLVLLALMLWAIFSCQQQYQRLMTQCIEDGRKEYECWSMIKGRH